MKRVITLLFNILFAITIMAQESVESKLDSVTILVGQQSHLTVDVTARKGQKIVFPTFKPSQYIVHGVEVLEASVPDTLELDNNLIKVSKVLTITSFDEHLYAIPGIKVQIDGKTIQGNKLALKVLTLDVDTLHPNKFYPPKDVQNNPFSWSEWSWMFWLSLLMLTLCFSGIYLLVRLRENKPIITKIRIVKRILPHQKALNVIEKLKSERTLVNDNPKEYYTKLTDALRQYIEERFGFNAMEMTSSEIIEHMNDTGDKKMIDELHELFQTADLVKFAKYSTLINENDLNLVNAINFIDQTKLENQPTTEKIVPKLSDDDTRIKHTRIMIKILLYAIMAFVMISLAYILYSIYQLMM